MATSRELISLMDFIDETGNTPSDLVNFASWMREDHPEHWPEPSPEDIDTVKGLRKLVSKIIRAKQEPTREVSDEVIESVVKLLGDEYIDHALTRLELEAVPGIVGRWKKLRTLSLVGVPTDRVTSHLRQAITCYLHGLPTASVILCRAVLEYALQECIFNVVGGIKLDAVNKKDWLEKLINLAEKSKVLPLGLVGKAHRIRKAGNNAAHEGSASERDALDQIRNTLDILQAVYHAPKRRVR